MGAVYHGVHLRLGTEMAVKVLHATAQSERFDREARLTAQLRSPHLVQVVDMDEDAESGLEFMVMEYVDGLSALAWRKGLAASGIEVSELDALDVCIAATAGLAVAHDADVVHRDVKPANILIPFEADLPRLSEAKLADLGLARMRETDEELTASGLGMGTPGYVAPEQVLDASSAGKPADVYGMGATLYALLAGRTPVSGRRAGVLAVAGELTPIREVRPGVSVTVVELVERCLARDPDRRCADATALLEELRFCRAAVAGPEPPPPTVETLADEPTPAWAQDVQDESPEAPVTATSTPPSAALPRWASVACGVALGVGAGVVAAAAAAPSADEMQRDGAEAPALAREAAAVADRMRWVQMRSRPPSDVWRRAESEFGWSAAETAALQSAAAARAASQSMAVRSDRTIDEEAAVQGRRTFIDRVRAVLGEARGRSFLASGALCALVRPAWRDDVDPR
jgi:tRNA A-37 threonylcarbamoyl transferase component Bud32